MCSASLTGQKQRLIQLLDDDLDENAQIACLRQLTLEEVDRDLLEYAVLELRKRMVSVKAETSLVDLCGTGGDKSGSFNISTTASLIVAGAGFPVAKHGNVSITSKSGSIDLLRALDIPLPETPAAAMAQLEQAGIMFLFAPFYHPAFKKFAPARKALAAEGTKTLFNLLGPLLNPAGAKRAVIGVFDPRLVMPVAEVLHKTGTEKALVFHGDGMDELSLTGVNHVCEINNGNLTYREYSSDSFDLPSCRHNDLAGGTPEENAQTALAILRGERHDAKTHMVLLNAGVAIYAACDDDTLTLQDGIALARSSHKNGDSLRVLERLRA